MNPARTLLLRVALFLGLAAASFMSDAQVQAVTSNSDATVSADPGTSQRLAQDAQCTHCHDESESKPILSIYKTPHGVRGDARAPTCQGCHGPSEAHIKGGEGDHRPRPDHIFGTVTHTYKPDGAEAQSDQCLGCHQTGLREHWSGSQHESQGIPCATCHTVHAPRDPVLAKATQPEVCFTCHKEQRAQIHRLSAHPLEDGKMACTDCHNPHGSMGPKLLARENVPELCLTCHAEKRGPFLWEHQPVSDDCTNCHTPHGSSNPTLLKTRVPFLCQDCHTGDHASGINSGSNLPGGMVTTVNGRLPLGAQSPRAQTNGRACLNCHVLIHGSNSPAGAKFQR